MVYALIMAGGKGTRFWPVSTPERPKQLLRFDGQRTMIKRTIDRLKSLIDVQQLRIVTIRTMMEEILRQVPDIKPELFILEPFAKNTSACIGLSALHLLKEDENAIMAVFPADHKIDNDEAFVKALKTGINFVEKNDAIVTIGLEPSRPETEYGYIQYNPDEYDTDLHKVITFAEKPNRETAIRFMETGEFLWNSGIFIWSAKRILSEIEENLPELYAALMEVKDVIGTEEEEEKTNLVYKSIKPISIDYGVMERARDAYVVLGEFSWSDIGGWEEVFRSSEKNDDSNVVNGPVVTLKTNNSIISSQNGTPVAVIGMNNIVVVHTEDGVLVCPRDQLQEVTHAAEMVFHKQKIKNGSKGSEKK